MKLTSHYCINENTINFFIIINILFVIHIEIYLYLFNQYLTFCLHEVEKKV